jgi:FixJ family two-component response regulator
LTRAEKEKAVKRMLCLHPERANAWIAADMGTSEHTVKKYREELEAGSQIATLQKYISFRKLYALAGVT